MISGFLIRKFICFFWFAWVMRPPPFDASSRIFGFGLIIRDIHTLTYYIAFRRDMALGWMCGLKPDGFISSVLGLYICVFLWDCSVSFLFCGIPYNVWFEMLTILLAIIFLFSLSVCTSVRLSVSSIWICCIPKVSSYSWWWVMVDHIIIQTVNVS